MTLTHPAVSAILSKRAFPDNDATQRGLTFRELAAIHIMAQSNGWIPEVAARYAVERVNALAAELAKTAPATS